MCGAGGDAEAPTVEGLSNSDVVIDASVDMILEAARQGAHKVKGGAVTILGIARGPTDALPQKSLMPAAC